MRRPRSYGPRTPKWAVHSRRREPSILLARAVPPAADRRKVGRPAAGLHPSPGHCDRRRRVDGEWLPACSNAEHRTFHLDPIVIAQSDDLANDGFGTAHWSECGADVTVPRASPSLPTGHMKSGQRPLRGLCQRNRKLGALPRDRGPGDWHKNVELSSQHFLSINTASDSDRKRPAGLGCAVSDLLMESITLEAGSRSMTAVRRPFSPRRRSPLRSASRPAWRYRPDHPAPPRARRRRLPICFGDASYGANSP